MDRHDVSDEVTAIHVAKLHKEDLKIEHKFGCKGLTYWFDEKRKTAFCLIEAPNEQAVHDMHNHAHGELPHRIIEVDELVVESFLGRIEDPEKADHTDLNIIDDPAFRIIMMSEFKINSLKNSNHIKNKLNIFNMQSLDLIDNFDGCVVKQNTDRLLVSFSSVSKAVYCALEIQLKFQEYIAIDDNPELNLKTSLCGGVPVTDNDGFFEDSIKFAERVCETIKGQIIISSEVKELFESENLKGFKNDDFIYSLCPSDEKFLNVLLDYTEQTWNKTNLKMDDFCEHLGISKSQLYRLMMRLYGKSLNIFLKEYRLNKALKLLNKQTGNISEIAFETGFNSPAYFSKCFQETFGILPSNFQKQLA
jgi:AraC-like DNA-binding protein